MRLLWRTWSNSVAWWWALLTLVSCGNIALWFGLFREFNLQAKGSSGIDLMLCLCAAYVFGCAFRSVLPRADVQRICLFDTWLSSVLVGRSVATVAEICFAVQWALVLRQLGGIASADTTSLVALAIVPLICLAQCCCWYGVLTTNSLYHAIENSIWAVAFFFIGLGLCLLLPEFDGLVRLVLGIGVIGIAAYLAFLLIIDVPMYVNRWRSGRSEGGRVLSPREGLRDVRTRWIVTHDFTQWKDEIAWMTLYFTAAVWASLALCLIYATNASSIVQP